MDVDAIKLLKERQGDLSDKKFANRMGLSGTSLWRYKNGQSDINAIARQKMVEYFARQGDAEMVGALLVYRSGYAPNRSKCVELGDVFLSSRMPS